jgi:hypothetical protein
MKYSVLLDRQANTAQYENEEKSKFIRSILEILNVDLEFWSEEEESSLTTDMRIKIRKVLTQYDLKIVELVDGQLDVFFESNLIAQWRKPNYTLKMDHAEVDPRERLYLEMEVNFWSVFEEEESSESD